MARLPILIDCDPGQDDALALLFALAARESLEVVGVTTVAGNVALSLTEYNARRICTLAGALDTPVYAGCPRPILRPLVTAEAVHGKSGLDGAQLPEPAFECRSQHAVDFLIDTLLERPAGSVTLCPLGPLTNIALALIKAPQIASRIREIVLMGGSTTGGNITPAAEFNIYVDPHAARVVFESGVALTMLGLNLTHQALVTETRLEAIRALGSTVSEAASGLLDFYNRFDRDRYQIPGAPLHDPCVIGYLLAPQLFGGRECHVVIETDSTPTLGATIVDWWHVTQRPANARVLDTIDADGFFSLLTEHLARYSS